MNREDIALRAARNVLPILFGADPAAIRGVDWGGSRSLILSLPAGTDVGPLLHGLPDNRYTCPHWGDVVKGRVRASYADSEEMLETGDLVYLPPCRTAFVDEDAELVKLRPPREHESVMEVVRRNAAVVTT